MMTSCTTLSVGLRNEPHPVLAGKAQQEAAPASASAAAVATEPPIHFFYTYFHNSIRAELEQLEASVHCLEHAAQEGLAARLTQLKERYRFLAQLYKYHSSVEDEVVYPALDAKVPNVTLAYSVEHQDEELLFEELAQLLSSAASQRGTARQATVRELVCKVEQIHITLRKHLGKEEEQLLPLLLRHFTYAEQAELVAQFLYCVPLAAVDCVLTWLKPAVPREKQQHLLTHIRGVISGNLLLDLLVSWLQPEDPACAAPCHSAPTAVSRHHSQRVPIPSLPDIPHHVPRATHALPTCSQHSQPDSAHTLPPPAAPDVPARGSACLAAGFRDAATPLQHSGSAGEAAAATFTTTQHPTAAPNPAASAGPDAESSKPAGVQTNAAGSSAAAAAAGPATPHAPAHSRSHAHHAHFSSGRPPLQELMHVHASIRSALQTFASEARALQRQPDVSAAQLSSLVERHRFLRSVCMFHTISEEEVLFPEILKLPQHCQMQACHLQHASSAAEALAAVVSDVAEGKEVGEGAATSADAVAAMDATRPMQQQQQLQQQRQQQLQQQQRQQDQQLEQQQQQQQQSASNMDVDMRAEDGFAPFSAAAVASFARAEMPAAAAAACEQCQEDHAGEVLLLDRLGRMLADVRAYARRGRKEVAEMLSQLCQVAEEVSEVMKVHMAYEEQRVFPLLQQHMAPDQQCALLWKTLKAMPLRLLERVMPWLVDTLSDAEVRELLNNIRRGAPPTETSLVELLTRWACRGRARSRVRGGVAPAAQPDSSSGGEDTSADTCEPRIVRDAFLSDLLEPDTKRRRSEAAQGEDDDTSSSMSQHSSSSGVSRHNNAAGGAAGGSGQTPPRGRFAGFNPIDHIFQFHKALRRELRQLEQDAMQLETLVLAAVAQPAPAPLAPATSPSSSSQEQDLGELQALALDSPTHVALQGAAAADPCSSGDVVAAAPLAGSGAAAAAVAAARCSEYEFGAQQRAGIAAAVLQLDGRFRFLWGIYRAHSRAEDEIVFPALESKEALMNVSHAYTLDHQQEEQLFEDLSKVLHRAQQPCSLGLMQDISMQLRRMCAAVRASVETHVRSEERELWPLFSEHFSVEEQQLLVGVIIGRTGAEVLQALLPFVTGSISEEEREAMMESLREATKNTKFDRWLECIQEGVSSSPRACHGSHHPHAQHATEGSGHRRTAARDVLEKQQRAAQQDLEAVAQYLRGDASTAPGNSSPTGTGGGGGAAAAAAPPAGSSPPSGADSSAAFHPGWEDIFRMNQKQLEAAVRRVCNDPNLEPERKAYLTQNIMVSRYVVAQQMRMHQQQTSSPTNSPQVQPTYHDEAAGILGCTHYRRACQLVAPCCSKAYTCRLCHNEKEHHQMDRYAVTQVRCMVCGTTQPAAQTCMVCQTSFARYYCSICHLYDDEPSRSIYHCPFCNCCRLGKGLGVDCFHCMNCNMCMNLSLAEKHHCREQNGESNCPWCHENLSESNQPVKALPCGHLMHTSCFASYTQSNYTCPICFKSVGDMSIYFRMLDSLLAADLQRMPPCYSSRTQHVLCNDCGGKADVPFHFVYHKCPHCQSYNTRVI